MKINKKYIVFDDGGYIYSNPDGTGFRLKHKIYERIINLAKEFNIKIPIACVASFFDIDKLYDNSNINPNIDKILNLLTNNKDYIEIWNHGNSRTGGERDREIGRKASGRGCHKEAAGMR